MELKLYCGDSNDKSGLLVLLAGRILFCFEKPTTQKDRSLYFKQLTADKVTAWLEPGIVNRTQSNWISIEPNPWIEFDWFPQSHEIELTQKKLGNRTQSNLINWIVFDWVRWPNTIEHNPMDWVRLASISHTKFDVRFRSIAELNRTQSMDWVRLSSIEFDFQTFDWVCRVRNTVLF